MMMFVGNSINNFSKISNFCQTVCDKLIHNFFVVEIADQKKQIDLYTSLLAFYALPV
jgi:hypothetical protein